MTIKEEQIISLRTKYEGVASCLNEKARRRWAGAEAIAYGRGGLTIVSAATGLARNTVSRGIKEIESPATWADSGVRQIGGGRKKTAKVQRGLRKVLLSLITPTVKGDPMNSIQWISKSVRNLKDELGKLGFTVSHTTISSMLSDLGYTLQANYKGISRASGTDRDEQFQFINDSISDFQTRGQPTISVDSKKKENIGNFKNNGQEYCEKGKPIKVEEHDFADKDLGKVVPYGVYDIGENKGWVSVGISSDTAEFAVNSIRTWWKQMGEKTYPNATELFITADCGGSNGYRVRLWKYELQKLADAISLKIHVSHFPPGTSKYNKIEHRLFSYITKNWRGRPLVTRETVVNLISNTSTRKGLKILAMLDENNYETGREVSEEDFKLLEIFTKHFRPMWNYVISPRGKSA